MTDEKDCYFLMCGDYESFKTDFIGAKNEPKIVDGKVIYSEKDNSLRSWNSNGIYKDWFEFVKGKKIEKTFSIHDPGNEDEWGLRSFKKNYKLRDTITDKEFYNPYSITIITGPLFKHKPARTVLRGRKLPGAASKKTRVNI